MPIGSDASGLLTVQEAARKLGWHHQTLRRYIRAGQLRVYVTPSTSPFGRRYKIHPRDLERLRARFYTPERIEALPIEEAPPVPQRAARRRNSPSRR